MRLIIINYPNNYTGRILHQDEAEALSAFNAAPPGRAAAAVHDEVYGAIVRGGVRSISMASCPEVADRVITINGFSKFAAMTAGAWSYLTAPQDITPRSTSCTSRASPA